MDKIRASIEAIAADNPRSDAWAEIPCIALPSDIVARLDAWIAARPEPKPSRAEVIRDAVSAWPRDQGQRDEPAEAVALATDP